MPRLFHVSENSGLARFEPRPVPSPDAGVSGLAVWAVDENRLVNYLLPRDCPRACYFAGAGANEADRAWAGPRRVVVVEDGWLSRIRAATLTLYEFDPRAFSCVDENAGYYIAREAVVPIRESRLADLPAEITRRAADFRSLPQLMDLKTRLVESTLDFSLIRMRNALVPGKPGQP